jgi:hypothetical protein
VSQSNVRAVFEFWTKWGLNYSTPPPVDVDDYDASFLDPSMTTVDAEANGLLSDASSSPIKQQQAPAEVIDFMKRHAMMPGPWEVYLSRATTQELDELDTAMSLNEEYHKFNRWREDEKGGRRTGEYFLHHYVKTHMPMLLVHTFKGAIYGNGKRKRVKKELEIFKDAFLCTWDDIDAAARRAISDVERPVMDDIWRKMENEKCVNASAFVFGKIRRMKTILFSQNPELDRILAQISDESDVKEQELIDNMVRAFKLDSMAREGLRKVKHVPELCKIAKELCDRCRDRMVANPSVHVVKLAQKAVAKRNPRKAYSTAMKVMMMRQMRLASMFDKESQYVLLFRIPSGNVLY